jgi:hypothetical protein
MNIVIGKRPAEKIKGNEGGNKQNAVASNHYSFIHIPKKIERRY